MPEKIEEQFPYYYKEANQISIDSQKYYMILYKTSLICLVLASLTSVFSSLTSSFGTILNWVTVLFLVISSVNTLVAHLSNLQKNWYDGRAVAESIKTMSWKYVMCTTPYGEGEIESQREFSKDILDILKNHKALAELINTRHTVQQELSVNVTEGMNHRRKESDTSKKRAYLSERIEDQLIWYKGKCTYNKKGYKRWLTISIGAQGLAIAYLIASGVDNNYTPALIGLIATISTSSLSWMQAKRYQELTNAYNTTALELQYLLDKGNQVEEAELNSFVLEAEKAISREHTLWIARRDFSKFNELSK